MPALSEGLFREGLRAWADSASTPPSCAKLAVRMVQDQAPEYPSQWVAIRSVAESLGCSVEALRRWVRQAERDGGQRVGLTTDSHPGS